MKAISLRIHGDSEPKHCPKKFNNKNGNPVDNVDSPEVSAMIYIEMLSTLILFLLRIC